jgi:hypothetical protein
VIASKNPAPRGPITIKKSLPAAAPAAEYSDTELYQVLDDRGGLLPGRSSSLDRETLLKIHRTLVLIRVLDDRMIKWQRMGKIGFYGAAFGEEGAVVGSAVPLKPEDWLFPALRQGGAALYRGYSLKHYIANVLGNSGDILKGRQMPCHYASRAINHVSWSSCIGPQIPHAVGAAWAFKIKKQAKVAVGYLGDGASSEGDFHVAMNFAGVFKVPAVLFLNNNQWAISVSSTRQTASRSFAIKRGLRFFGHPGGRQRRACGRRGDEVRGGQGENRGRADADRSAHLPARRPFHLRRPQPLSRRERGGALEEREGSAGAAGEIPAAQRHPRGPPDSRICTPRRTATSAPPSPRWKTCRFRRARACAGTSSRAPHAAPEKKQLAEMMARPPAPTDH